MIFLASVLLFFYVAFTVIVLDKIYKGYPVYLLLYIVSFLPFYTIFQVIVFNAFENTFVVSLIKYSKDFVLFSCFILYIIGTRKSFFKRKFKFSFLDKLIIGFLFLVIVYLFIPLGDAAFASKIIYSKNILLIGVVYFFGRNTEFKIKNWNVILKILIGLTLLSFTVALTENILGTHLHSYLGFSEYNLIINDIDPQGNYGLSWSFERQNIKPRYAAFFADPLEFSASNILFFIIALWFLLHSRYIINKFYYLLLMLIVIISFFLATSRASMFSTILVFIIGLYISKQYQLILRGSLISIILFIYLFFFSSEETKYLIEDTIFFQSTSSLGHLVEWIEGLLSIYENPLGIGLAMSGNASGVDQSIKIGGENQFLIYGVQMGIVSVLLYLIILFKSIWNSIRVYIKSVSLSKKSIGFITGLTKFGLLIPLFTANAELYLFVALFSWYLVGQVESLYNSFELNNKLKIEKG